MGEKPKPVEAEMVHGLKKSGRSHFGFKLHTKIQRGSKIIEEIAVTTARVFDGHIDLAKPDEINYRDRGYSGTKTKR